MDVLNEYFSKHFNISEILIGYLVISIPLDQNMKNAPLR